MLAGRLTGLGFFDWVRAVTRIHREVITDEDRRDAALAGVADGLEAGITTFADTAANDAPFQAMRSTGVRGIAYREVFGPDPAQCAASLAGLQREVAAMRQHETALVKVGVSPHAPYSVSDDLFRAVSVWAAAGSLPVAIHIAESQAESDLVERGAGPFAEYLRGRGVSVPPRGDRAMAIIGDAGLFRRDVLLIHCVRATDADVHDIALAGCGVAHCPASNHFLQVGIAPLREFLKAGARVGLGSDSMGSAPHMRLLGHAAIAITQQDARLGPRDSVGKAAAFRLLTLGGAEALRLDAEIGSLVPGKQADLSVFARTDGSPIAADPLEDLIDSVDRVKALRVMVAGRERQRDGQVIGFDPGIRARVRDAGVRVAEWRTRSTVG
jgi:cytosine/adenosine deaminase-related metal-dependent hydrolase